MSFPPPAKRGGGGMSLYANLLSTQQPPDAANATISGTPVKYALPSDAPDGAGAPADVLQKKNAALQFQPIRRPQATTGVKGGGRPKQQPGGSSTGAHQSSSSIATTTASSPDKQPLPPPTASTTTPQQQPMLQSTSTLADWVGDDEDAAFLYQQNQPKQERGGRKAKKKKEKSQREAARVWDWDDVYDPTLPNVYADYKGSEEQYREVRDWKARLYYRQLKLGRLEGGGGGGVGAVAGGGSEEEAEEEAVRRPANKMFAPPASLDFAPPVFNDGPALAASRATDADDDEDYYPPSDMKSTNVPDTSDGYEPPPAFGFAQNSMSVADTPSGEDAYTRRMQFSTAASPPALQQAHSMPPPPPPQQQVPAASGPPPGVQVHASPSVAKAAADIAAKKAEALAKIAAYKAKIEAARALAEGTAATTTLAPAAEKEGLGAAQSGEPTAHMALPPLPPPPLPRVEEPGLLVSRAAVLYGAPPSTAEQQPGAQQISRAPVLYSAPAAAEAASSASPAPEPTRSNRPGQKGFAERLLKKYGWEKGQGLGAPDNEGITTAVVAQAAKRKKGGAGGGWTQPGVNMGKLVGGKRRKVAETEADDGGEFGEMSEVVKLEGMCEGMDLDAEIAGGVLVEGGAGEVGRGLYQEIGDEMEAAFGKVERIVIWRREQGGGDDVFVKFVSRLSALRCVGGCEGVEFNGRGVRARFFGVGGFERGEYS
ncbi:hypothetical protein LTR08_003335 [Meristemomyces frigidus]|nr:hypothetical protein LTR08_003335 [Meristemomyces frigidus]